MSATKKKTTVVDSVKITLALLTSKATAMLSAMQKSEGETLDFVVHAAEGVRTELVESAASALTSAGITEKSGVKPSFTGMERYVRECVKYRALYSVDDLLTIPASARNFQIVASALKFVGETVGEGKSAKKFTKAGVTRLLKKANVQASDVKSATGQAVGGGTGNNSNSGSGNSDDSGSGSGGELVSNFTVHLANANTILRRMAEGGADLGKNERAAIVSNIRGLIAHVDAADLRTICTFCTTRLNSMEKGADTKGKASAKNGRAKTPKTASSKKSPAKVKKAS